MERRVMLKGLLSLPLSYLLARLSRTIIQMTAFITPVQLGLIAEFRLTRPDGQIIMQWTTTDEIGRATVDFMVKKRDPRGIYQGAVFVGGLSDQGSVLI